MINIEKAGGGEQRNEEEKEKLFAGFFSCPAGCADGFICICLAGHDGIRSLKGKSLWNSGNESITWGAGGGMKSKKKPYILIGIVLGVVALILYPHRATIFGTIIGALLFPLLALMGGMNSPAEYEIANEIGEPLSYNEVWNETGIFELKIKEIKEVPLDRLLETEEGSPEGDTIKAEDLDGYKQEGITKALEIVFAFKNIGYDGWQDGTTKRTGLTFHARGAGYDKDGVLVQPVPLKDVFGFGRSYGEEIEKGMTAEDNHLVLLIPEDTRKVKLTFQAMKSRDYRYENSFYYDIP